MKARASSHQADWPLAIAHLSAGVCEIGIDFVRQTVSGTALLPRNLMHSAVRCAAAGAQAVAAAGGGAVWREVENKLRAWELFSYADRFCDRGAFDLSRLPDVVLEAQKLGPHAAVWVTEGIGYAVARSAPDWGRTDCPLRFALADLPPNARLPLHSGFGLGLSERALERAGAGPSGLAPALTSFREACSRHALPGFAEVLGESLGLTAITLYPHLIGSIDKELSNGSDLLGDLFWHGVGRGLYFTPLAFLPLGSMRNRAVEYTRAAPVSEAGRLNALAGLAWATTLVNIGDPEVLECWLRDNAWSLQDIDAFQNGVTSALLVWESVAPLSGQVEALAAFELRDPDAGLMALWERTVSQPCRDARGLRDLAQSGTLAAAAFCVRPLWAVEQHAGVSGRELPGCHPCRTS